MAAATALTIQTLLASPALANDFALSVTKLLRSSYDNTAEKAEIKLIQQLYDGSLKLEEPTTNPISNQQKLSGKWGWPCVGATITSHFGFRIHPIYKTKKMHTGVDFGAGLGTNVLASRAGVVTNAAWTGGYGLTVDINHGGGFSTRYAHNSKLLVQVGAEVKQGQVISRVGSTGNSTGPHLHFEIIVNGEPQDPETYLK